MGNYLGEERCRDHLGATTFAQLYRLPQDADALAQDVTLAEAEVDGFLGRRYATPITNSTALNIVRALALDLWAERAMGRGAGSEVPGKWMERAKRARNLLEEMRAGTLSLAGATSVPERATGGADAIVVEGNDPTFEREDLAGF